MSRTRAYACPMATFSKLLLGYMWDCFWSHERLKAEILAIS
jgi:hypothetical protein